MFLVGFIVFSLFRPALFVDPLRIPLTKSKDPHSLQTLVGLVEGVLLNGNATAAASIVIRKSNYQYYGSIKAGSPDPQEFKVAFDTTSSLILVSSVYSSTSCTENHGTFNESISKTFKRTGQNETGPQPYTLFEVAEETFTIGGVSVPGQTFGLALDGNCTGIDYDGFLGLGLQVTNKEPSVIYRMYAQKLIPEYVAGLHFNRDMGSISGGEVMIGGVNEHLFHKKSVKYIRATDYTPKWTITISSVTLGSVNIENVGAVLDSSSSYISVPAKFLNYLKETYIAVPADGGFIVIEGGLADQLPPIVFNIDDRNYTLYGREYVDMENEYKHMRRLLLRVTESEELTLGCAFLGKFYTILDYEKRQIAFASLNGAAKVNAYWLIAPLIISLWSTHTSIIFKNHLL